LSALLSLPIAPDELEYTDVSFGEWLPDLPELNNPGGLEALNVLPDSGGYRPFPQLQAVGGAALSDPIRGATAVISPLDITQLYAGTRNGVYSKIGAGVGPFTTLWEGISNDDFSFKFIRVGDVMVAVHPEHNTAMIPIGSLLPGSYSLVGTTTKAPWANCGAQVGDFLMLGNLTKDFDDGSAAFPSRVRWGGLNNIQVPWVSDPATQADYQDMPPEGGPVTAITGREYATVFQARMISRLTYRGLPDVFDNVIVEDKRGCIARDCVVDVGAYSFFIAEDGFFVWNGTNSSPIGDNKVNRYFFRRLQWSRRSRIVGGVDFQNGCVLWAFPTDSSGVLNEIIIYSYRDNRWSHSIQALEYLLTSAASNVTLDELTAPLESYVDSFDSPLLKQGGKQLVAAFNTSHAYGTFSGKAMAAIMDTGEYNSPDGRRIFANGSRPLVDIASPDAVVRTITRDQGIGQTIVVNDPVAQEADGTCPIISEARYMRFRMELPVNANWNFASGIAVNRRAGGLV
jgi:hypothetical protein